MARGKVMAVAIILTASGILLKCFRSRFMQARLTVIDLLGLLTEDNPISLIVMAAQTLIGSIRTAGQLWECREI